MHKKFLRAWQLLSLRICRGSEAVAKVHNHFFETEISEFVKKSSGTIAVRIFNPPNTITEQVFIAGNKEYEKTQKRNPKGEITFYEVTTLHAKPYTYTVTTLQERHVRMPYIYGWREEEGGNASHKNECFLETVFVPFGEGSALVFNQPVYGAFSDALHKHQGYMNKLPEKPLLSWLVGGRRAVAKVLLSKGPD